MLKLKSEGDKQGLAVGLGLLKTNPNKEVPAYGKEDSVSCTKLEGLQSQFD